MTLALLHGPAKVLRRLLVDLGFGSLSSEGGGPWPLYVSNEPATPDNVMTLYDTDGRGEGRTMIDGARQEHYGFQLRIRGVDDQVGSARSWFMAHVLDQRVYNRACVVDRGLSTEARYVVYSVSRTTGVISLGTEEGGASKRSIFTLNGLVALRRVA